MSKDVTLPPIPRAVWPITLIENLVVSMPLASLASAIGETPAGVRFVRLDAITIQRLFAGDGELMSLYLRHAELGYAGGAYHDEAGWICAAWMAHPGSRRPAHLPRLAEGRHWIFGARTHAERRSKGLARACVSNLARSLPQPADPATMVYADVLAENHPSRRALRGLGFEPAGRMTSLEVPRFGWSWGLYRANTPHPPLTEGAEEGRDMILETALAHPGYLSFVAEAWGLTARTLTFALEGGCPSIEATLFLDPRGRATMPPLTPYTPLRFTPTPTRQPGKLGRQWLDASEGLVEAMASVPWRAPIVLPPGAVDARAWSWRGYRLGVKYTYVCELPFDAAKAEKQVRGWLNRAERRGLRCGTLDDLDAAFACLRATEHRQGFSHGLREGDLARLRELMGPEAFRVYGCMDAEGAVAAVSIVLHQPGAPAIGWVAGVADDALSTGAGALLDRHLLTDLARVGATAYDFCGANIPSVAAYKSQWGGCLTPFFTLERPALKGLARNAVDYARFLGRARVAGSP